MRKKTHNTFKCSFSANRRSNFKAFLGVFKKSRFYDVDELPALYQDFYKGTNELEEDYVELVDRLRRSPY